MKKTQDILIVNSKKVIVQYDKMRAKGYEFSPEVIKQMEELRLAIADYDEEYRNEVN